MGLYSDILKRGATASAYDQKIFNRWKCKQLTLRECFEWFMKNNVGHVDERYWNPTLFEQWLHSLGY